VSSRLGCMVALLPLCCAVLCCAVLCCAVLCCAVLCCAVLCCAVLCCAVLCCAVLCPPVAARDQTNKFSVVEQGQGVGGSAAACADLQADGGMTWGCRWV
jgi:hypothetical protein